MPRVSVVIPIYNAERYLREAVGSILKQSCSDFEVLLLNDGSSDASADIAREHARSDPRVVFVDGDHQGVVYQRNLGVELAHAPLVAMMDADDIALPRRLGEQVRFMDENPDHVVVGSRVLRVDSDGLPIDEWKVPLSHEDIDGAHLRGEVGAIVNPSVLMRRAAVERVGGYSPVYTQGAEDYDLFLRLAEVGRLTNLEEILLHYRLHGKNLTFLGANHHPRLIHNALADTWRRRELPGVPTVSAQVLREVGSEEELVWNWARNAFASGNFAAARNQSLRFLRYRPFELRSWVMFIAALLGPVAREFRRVLPYRVGNYSPSAVRHEDQQRPRG